MNFITRKSNIMKSGFTFIVGLLTLLMIDFNLSAQPFELSQGIYRIPFTNGTTVNVSRDHLTHSPVQNRIDMWASGSPSTIVAAADGWIEAIVDNNTVSCTGSGCSDFNNYVWLRHVNGEWTKYTHFTTGSVTALGHQVGDWVCAGTALGTEGDIGAASGVHLHFEVAVPNDPNNAFTTLGGFVIGQNRIPQVCGISNGVYVDGASYTAGTCASAVCALNVFPSNQTINTHARLIQAVFTVQASNYVVDPTSSVKFRAGNFVDLEDGFEANAGAFFEAQTGPCNSSNVISCGAKTGSEEVDATETEAELNPVQAGAPKLRVYPNPFKSQTTIDYEVSEGTDVLVEIRDLQGRIISTQVDHEWKEPGRYKTIFEAGDIAGGQYLVIVKTGYSLQTKPLVLIRD